MGFREAQKTATALGMEAIVVEAPLPGAFELAFAQMRAARIDVGIIPPSASNLDAGHEIYDNRAFVDSGGLISYGTSRAGRAAVFVDKISSFH
jgi:hypothetical protein